MLLVELVRRRLRVAVQPVVQNLASLLVQQQSKLLAWVANRVGVRDLREDLGHDHGDSFAIFVFLFGGHVDFDGVLKVRV